MEKKCSVKGCPKPKRTRGMCNMHYERWRTTGEIGEAKPRRGYRNSLPEGQIPLTRGLVASVDLKDYKRVMAIGLWTALKVHNKDRYYAVHNMSDGGILYMHRLVMNAEPGREIDHEDGDGLNNRRSNLRFATSAQNKYNRGSNKNGSSQYKGVSWFKNRNIWRVTINGKSIGYFYDEEDAARAYDQRARELHGDFARLNFPDLVKP